MDLWLSTTYIHLGMCLLVNPSPYTGEDLMNYKSLDCYINFVSGWVREVFVRKVNDKRVVIIKVSHACLDHQAIVPTYVCMYCTTAGKSFTLTHGSDKSKGLRNKK